MAKKTTIPPKPTGKRARIIANSMYPAFKEEYERTKDQYAKYYPGGVDFVEAKGYEELQRAFGKVAKDEDLIMMAHYNPDSMYGVDVANPSFGGVQSPQDNTLAGLFSGLEKKGYKGNCYLGICHGEEIAENIQNAGVNIPIFTTPKDKKWYGSNPAGKGEFENFFFGVSGENENSTQYETRPINPTIGQDYKLNISPKQQELMNRRASGTPLKEVTPLKGAKNGKKLLQYEPGGIIEKLGGASGIANTATGLIQGFQMLQQDNQNQDKAEQLLALSKVVGQAASLTPDQSKRKYIRPEDMIIDPNQLSSSYGTGTNYLAKHGKKLPSYEPGGFLNGEEGNVGSMLGSLLGGGGGQMSGAGKIGSTIGGVAGSFLGPIGGIAGSAIGGVIGGVIGGNKQKQTERQQEEAYKTLGAAVFQQGVGSIHNQNSAFMKKGGKIPTYNMGGELQVYKGEAETISENPYLPDGGQTVMFKGPSHEDGGMPVKFGKSAVEVEGGEPAVKLPDGKKNNLVIFGDMKIPSYGVSELNDPKAKGKKFKNYINELSRVEDKQNKIATDGLELINSNPIATTFDKLKFNSGKAMLTGSDMKLKEIAGKKQIAASIQNAILETAEERGLDSTELAKGNIKKAKKGSKIMAENGIEWPPKSAVNNPEFHKFKDRGINIPTSIPVDLSNKIAFPDRGGMPFAHQVDYTPREDGFADSTEPSSAEQNKFDWTTVFNSVVPFLRPSNQTKLDPNQLSGEMFALANNQLEPVQAQTYSPLLESVSDISLQDQLNANQSDFNAIQRSTAGNPAAQSILAAQKYAANSNVLGEQFRLNQAQKMGTFNRNRATLNDAQLRNLSILDQQYVRQTQAKSNTKTTAQSALNSISEKIARNKLENRTLGIYENLYNYRFGPKGMAFNMNPLAQFDTESVNLPTIDATGREITRESTVTTSRDRMGIPTGTKQTSKEKEKVKNGNGGIVKAIKGL